MVDKIYLMKRTMPGQWVIMPLFWHNETKNNEYLQMVIKEKLSTVPMTKGRGCSGPYMKRNHRVKAKCTRKHMKHSTRGRGHLPEGANTGVRLS
jgi:hypothetical protein